jgi:hypothetical protein
MGIEPFTEPLTAGAISEWLSRCERDFEEYQSNLTEGLTNKQKIQRTAKSISTAPCHASKSLSTWYNRNRQNLETKDWDSFQNLIKEHALGKGWRIKVLRDFYTYNQGLTTLDDYLEKFEELKFAVEHSRLGEIDAMVYKCHVLFGSKPSLLEKFIRTHKNDQQFISYDMEDIRTILKDFDGEGVGPQTQCVHLAHHSPRCPI